MAQTMNSGRKTADATASGAPFFNIVTASIGIENPKVISVEWVDESGNRASAVKYGVPVSLRVTTEDGARCSIILYAHCTDWQQAYVAITKIGTNGVPYAPQATEETTITFTPNAEWLVQPGSASGEITATAYIVWNKADLGQQDEIFLRGTVEAFEAGRIRLREFWRFREPVFFDFKQAETLRISTNRLDIDTLSISQRGIEFIKSWEKLKLTAYNDSEGYATIGYGHLIGRYAANDSRVSERFPNGIIDEETADELLRGDIANAESTLKGAVGVALYQHEYDALVSLVYNMGRTDKAPRLFRFLNRQEYDSAANEFADITNKGTPGLIIRRQDEINMFKNNIYNNHN